MKRALVLALALAALGCQTAKTNAYNEEYDRLQQQAQQQRQMDEMEHAAAQKFAAIVYFATGSAALDADAQQQLRWFAGKMGPYPLATFDVQGFADSTGSEATNAALSGERAQAVSNYMQSLGIASQRIYATGFGTSSPAASNATTAGRKNNRRVEVTVR
jgi:outer membrane protein OmpA-like peptidoglycan-associated protein